MKGWLRGILGSPQLRRREMTSSVIKKYALAALCGAAIIGVGQSAQAATWSIVLGVPSAPSSAANYGTAPNQNNVINNPASATHDLINVPINTSAGWPQIKSTTASIPFLPAVSLKALANSSSV